MEPNTNYNKYHLLKEGETIKIKEFKEKPKINNIRVVRIPLPLNDLSTDKTDNKNAVPKITNNQAKDKKLVIVENILLKSPLKIKGKSSELNDSLLKTTAKIKQISSLANVEKVNSKDYVIKTPKEIKVNPIKRKIDVGNIHGKKQKNKWIKLNEFWFRDKYNVGTTSLKKCVFKLLSFNI